MSEKSEKSEKPKKPKKKIIKFPKVNEAMLPQWLHPVKDQADDVIDYTLDQAHCALAVIENMQLRTFTGGEDGEGSEAKDIYS